MNTFYKKTIKFIFITLLSLYLFPSIGYAQLQHQSISTSQELAIAEGQKILKDLRMNDASYTYSHFDKQMKARLTTKQLTETFISIEKRCGDYQSDQDWVVTKNGLYTIVTAQVNFKQMPIHYLITFNMDNLIAGLYFKPLAKTKEKNRK